MKKWLILLLCVLLAFPALAEPGRDFSAALRELHPEGEILSASCWEPYGAAVIRSGEGCFLSVLEEENGQWELQYENHRAVREGSTVLLDSDQLLILSNPADLGPNQAEQYHFYRADDWKLSFMIRYETNSNEYGIDTEYITELEDGWVSSRVHYTDPQENFLGQRRERFLPDVLTEEEKSLAFFDGQSPAVTPLGYFTDDTGMISREMLLRLFSACAPEGLTFADGCLTEDGLQFVADRPDGTRVLYCTSYPDKTSYRGRAAESGPLPAGTGMGIENFTTTLNLGGEMWGASLKLNREGFWGISAFSFPSGEEYIGPCWMNEGGLWWNSAPLIGTTAWNDICGVDWKSLPRSIREAREAVDSSGWATPANPDPQDRLHLREAPQKDARSLGKYYNGTPLRVLEQGKEWTKVAVGESVGYMMNRYLLFGREMAGQETALRGKVAKKPLTKVFWEDRNGLDDSLLPWEVSDLLIVGVKGEDWFLVWEPETNRFGRIAQSELWDGNG